MGEQRLKWPGQAGRSGDGGVEGVENLAHFEHKRTLSNMDNTIFSLTSGGSYMLQKGAQTGAGDWAPWPLTLTTGVFIYTIIAD